VTAHQEKKEEDDLAKYPAPQLLIGVPKEVAENELRVAIVPDMVKDFYKLGFQVLIEAGAGSGAGFTDEQYLQQGARVESTEHVWSSTDVVLKVREPLMNSHLNMHEVDLLNPNAVLISFISPAQNPELLARLATRGLFAVLALDCVPRITRAQKLDVLSSMANLAGHRAVLEAAYRYPRFLQGTITAAGKFPPAKVLIIGAGVAGLAALGTARALGCIVRAFDTRHEVKEQVESLGGEFLEVSIKEDGTGIGGYAKQMSKEFIDAEMKLFADQCREVDIVITTANIPGRRAPILITEEMVRLMHRGSVVVDLAAANGGNCALIHPGEVYVDPSSGVVLVGYTDLPSRMAEQASLLYCTNLKNMVEEMGGRTFKVDLTNEIIQKSCVVFQGSVVWAPPQAAAAPAPAPAAKKPEEVKIDMSSKLAPPPKAASQSSHGGHAHTHGPTHDPLVDGDPRPYWIKPLVVVIVCGGLLAGIGLGTPSAFHQQLFSFVLAVIIGYHVIWSVTAALHTPLMSVTNAISGIILVGSMVELGGNSLSAGVVLGAIATAVASINIIGGFIVTYRMLKMFHK